MRKLKSLTAFNNQQANTPLTHDALRAVHGGDQTATKVPVTTDQGPDADTDCAEKVTYDDGTVIFFIDKAMQ